LADVWSLIRSENIAEEFYLAVFWSSRIRSLFDYFLHHEQGIWMILAKVDSVSLAAVLPRVETFDKSKG
jgi:hypothetical protein